jgi:hypothetical protein
MDIPILLAEALEVHYTNHTFQVHEPEEVPDVVFPASCFGLRSSTKHLLNAINPRF